MNRTQLKKAYILASVVLFSLAVTFVDAVVQPPYFTKIPVKILFFLALPLLFFALFREELPQLRRLFQVEKRAFGLSLLLGAAIYGLIVGGYLLTRSVFDFSAVTGSLTAGMGITAENFLWVAAYISFLNSFLEEFFFRGFGFMALRRYVGGRLG